MHDVNGRWWYTECEPYSQTTRCTTQIWATFAKRGGNGYQKVNDWTFNNLTYLPKMTRAEWAHNPLGFTGSWAATDRRQWRTECDTPRTGRGGRRSYVVSTMVETTSLGYRTVTKEVFNNIVLFSDG